MTSRLRNSALSEDLSFLLARASAVSVAAGNAALSAHGLRARSYAVLTVVADGARPTQRELADYLRLDPSQVVAIVDDLESRGLVERAPNPSDRRAKVIVLTAAGARLHGEARETARKAAQAAHPGLSDADRPRVVELLRGLAFPGE
jgi:DNA-binding MarR family transcriptional regulator